jgi:hypothetical protein
LGTKDGSSKTRIRDLRGKRGQSCDGIGNTTLAASHCGPHRVGAQGR